MAALADSETQALFHGNGGDQLNMHIDVVAGHAHLGALGQGDDAGNVGGAEVELRTIAIEERSMAATLVLGKDVNLTLKYLCLLYTSPSPRDRSLSRMPSSA